MTNASVSTTHAIVALSLSLSLLFIPGWPAINITPPPLMTYIIIFPITIHTLLGQHHLAVRKVCFFFFLCVCFLKGQVQQQQHGQRKVTSAFDFRSNNNMCCECYKFEQAPKRGRSWQNNISAWTTKSVVQTVLRVCHCQSSCWKSTLLLAYWSCWSTTH